MKKGGAIYIMNNKNTTVLYIGVTEDLIRRVFQHTSRIDSACFTYKHNLIKLIYFESFHNIEEAIFREKQRKAGIGQEKKG